MLCALLPWMTVLGPARGDDAAPLGGALLLEVQDKRTGAPVGEAALELDGRKVDAWSDERGRVVLSDLAPGRHSLTVLVPGYEPFSAGIEIRPGGTTPLTVALQARGSDQPEEILIRARRLQQEISSTALNVEEVRKIPGTQGDVVKVVQSLPGVARFVAMGGEGLVVRGAAPEDSKVFLDGHVIPLLYHFGGLRSVLNSDMLKRIDFLPGGFGANFGEAIGGVVDVQTRANTRTQLDGYVEMSMLDSGFFVEGPLGADKGFTLAARRSTLDLWLPHVLPESPGFELTVAPVYFDYQAKLDYSPNPAHRFTALAFGSRDELRFLFQKPPSGDPSLRGDFSMWIEFHRLNLTWFWSPIPAFQLRSSGSAGLDRTRFAIGQARHLRVDVPSLSLRSDGEWELSRRWKWTLGLSGDSFWVDYSVSMPRPPKEGEVRTRMETEELLQGGENYQILHAAAYLMAQFRPWEALLLVGGLRLSVMAASVARANLQPRLSAQYQWRPGSVFKAGAGLYAQPAQPDELSADFGNPRLLREKAWHFTLGMDQELPSHFKIDVQTYYKWLTDLVVTDQARVYNNEGVGRIWGAEVLLRRELSNNAFGWLAYTLMRSERRDHPGDGWRLFDFDQTHILTLVAGYRIPRGEIVPAHGQQSGWDLGVRFQLVSGNPVTPLVGGIYDADYDTYLPIAGEINSERLPLYHRLDFRVDYTWAFTAWALSVYLDVQNLYNHRSIEGVRYNVDYTQRAYFEGLPTIGALGIKGSF